MRLFIAEKPSLARAIADVLPKPHRKGDGFIECGNGQVVTWCIGHLLEQAQPDAYDSRYARWNLADLPIVPEKWQLQPRPSVTKQLNVIKRFLHEASEIVHAGDPDREGQLLVDEVLDYLQLAPEKRQQVQRCLINDLNPQAVERAIDRLRSNSEFVPLCVSALARARADWLYGINMTVRIPFSVAMPVIRAYFPWDACRRPCLGWWCAAMKRLKTSWRKTSLKSKHIS